MAGQFATAVTQLAEPGWVVLDDALPLAQVRALHAQAEQEWRQGKFRAAGVGQGRVVTPGIRADRIHWVDTAEEGALAAYHTWIEALRLAINETLWLGLFDFEAHFAVYPPGAFYRKHVDNLRGSNSRLVTAILYLNEAWQPEEGGQLRLYTDGEGAYQDIYPCAGRLVLFRSELFWHEVLPATRARYSLTGWLRARGAAW